jgi:hypothetical protein
VPFFPDFGTAVEQFHETLTDLARHLEAGTELRGIALENLMQGPCSDAMSYAVEKPKRG